jgi:CubicO group peptidase (beta-lactamase class C family)
MADLRTGGGGRPARAPTVRDLLRHTSGFAYPAEIRDPSVRGQVERAGIDSQLTRLGAEAFVQRLASAPLAAEPGTAFRYGFSTDVLGVVLETVEGRPLAEVLRARIFERLGMTETTFAVSDSQRDRLAAAHRVDAAWHAVIAPLGVREPGRPWLDSGGGGLVGTIDDYARFARALADGGRAGGEALLSDESFALLSRDQLPVGVDGPSGYTGPGYGFSLGLAVRLDWGPAAMPCRAGELVWSGLSGTALFVDPARRWFALAFTCNTGSRLMARFEFRRALGA